MAGTENFLSCARGRRENGPESQFVNWATAGWTSVLSADRMWPTRGNRGSGRGRGREVSVGVHSAIRAKSRLAWLHGRYEPDAFLVAKGNYWIDARCPPRRATGYG